MKKYFGIFLAAMLMVGAAGQAMAYFADGELFRVVYNHNGQAEVATDLGSATSLAGTAANANLTVGGGAAAFSLGMVTGATGVGDLYVAYFGKIGIADAWISGNPAVAPVAGKLKGNGFNSDVTGMSTNYGSFGGTTGTVTGQQSHPNSFNSLFNDGPLEQYNFFGGFIPLKSPGGEMNLAALSTVGYVDQVLYFWDTPNSFTTAFPGVATVTLRTMADGSTIINPGSAVPIPPSVLLLGSGLLGMIGIRRKISA